MIVLDASTAIELVLGTRRGKMIGNRVKDERTSLQAPHLIDLEVAQVLRRYEQQKLLPADRVRTAL